jgi:hypothetical protein
MTSFRLLSLLCFTALIGCAESEKTPEGIVDGTLFYPAFTFINQELSHIDSNDVALFTYEWDGGKEDTSLTEKPAFRQWVETLFSPEMLAEPSKFAFHKSVFMDETIGRITISLDAVDPAATVRRMDIHMDPETEAIKSIYTEQILKKGDTLLKKRVTWLAGQQLSSAITRIIQQDTLSSRMKIVWGSPQ